VYDSPDTLARGGRSAVPVLVYLLRDQDLNVKQECIRVLGRMGAEAESSVSVLIALLEQDDELRWPVAHALGNIGISDPELSSTLRDLFQSGNADVRASVICVLRATGDDDDRTKAIILKALHDEDSTVRGEATGSIWRIGLATEEVIPLLKIALRDGDRFPRYMAARSLEDMGSKARDAAQSLIDSLTDEDLGVRRTAARALRKMGVEVP
jgi:HEAT repeat protein